MESHNRLFDRIVSAASVIAKVARHTPLLESISLRDRLDPACKSLWFKPENLQRAGSFKIRGAYYRLSLLSNIERTRGVVAASAGNHAQGVALAARLFDIPSVVFMPETASIAKIKATEGYGARVELVGQDFDQAMAACLRYVDESNAVYISPYDDEAIIAGQGTIGLEIIDDLPNVDTVVIPIGGGGLFSGTAAALKERKPSIRVIGVQADGADNAVKSFRAGRLLERMEPVHTICDGIAVKSPSDRTFEYIRRYADDVVAVSDADIAQSMSLLLEHCKLVVEPSGAAGLAALMAGKANSSGHTLVVIGGGNIDSLRLADIAQREQLRAGRYIHLFTAVADYPGALVRLLTIVASERGNVVNVNHNRLNPRIGLGMTGVELLIEVRDREHGASIIEEITAKGYRVERFE